MASQPLLNFIDYRLEAIGITPLDSFDPTSPKRGQITTTFSVSRLPDNPQQFHLALVVEFTRRAETENVPYEARIAMTGEFFSMLQLRADQPIPEIVAKNALTLLYGTARGIAGQLTADGSNGRFVLPTVTFDELLQLSMANEGSGIGPNPPELKSLANFDVDPAPQETSSTVVDEQHGT